MSNGYNFSKLGKEEFLLEIEQRLGTIRAEIFNILEGANARCDELFAAGVPKDFLSMGHLAEEILWLIQGPLWDATELYENE